MAARVLPPVVRFHAERCLLVLVACLLTTTTGKADGERVLTRAADVLRLSSEEAARALPASLRGVVVGEAPIEGQAFVLWDQTDYIYVRGDDPRIARLHRGDRVEVDGVSNPGGYAPHLMMQALRVVGTDSLPAATPVTIEQLEAREFDCHWVRVRGVVRDCRPLIGDTGETTLELAIGRRTLTVHVNDQLDPPSYVDARVSLEGFYLSQHNVSRQFLKPLFFVPRGVGVVIDSPAPAEPFATPISAVAHLMQFDPQVDRDRRVHVRGVVLHQLRGAYLWLRDGERGLQVKTRQEDDLRPGAIVDVLGFVAHGGYMPRLEDAVFRCCPDSSTPPRPVHLTDSLEAIRHDADLVALRGQLVEKRRTPEGIGLTLAWNDTLVSATLAVSDNVPTPDEWETGSLVEVTGICSVLATEGGPPSGTWQPQTFDLSLRTPSDVRVLKPPPWWTRERLLTAMGLAGAVSLLVVVAIVSVARRRLREQARRREMAELEFSAILAERNRVAREVHDTLAQGLGAISMQLELAKCAAPNTDSTVAHHLETAHQLVRRSLAEARSSIWNMRSQVLEKNDLGGALRAILCQFTDGTGVTMEMQVTGRSRRLPPVMENNLLRIGQEAITNAMKHAGAHHLEVHLGFSGGQVHLTVTDDGGGFVPDRATPSDGCFGLVGMRERAAQMRSTLEVESTPGQGTRVHLTVPTPE